MIPLEWSVRRIDSKTAREIVEPELPPPTEHQYANVTALTERSAA